MRHASLPVSRFHARATVACGPAHDPRAALRSMQRRALRSWLALGLLAVALLPQARGFSEAIGWLPFWLVLAPLAMLATAEHARVGSALGAVLAGTGRPRALRRPQARVLRSRIQRQRARAA